MSIRTSCKSLIHSSKSYFWERTALFSFIYMLVTLPQPQDFQNCHTLYYFFFSRSQRELETETLPSFWRFCKNGLDKNPSS